MVGPVFVLLGAVALAAGYLFRGYLDGVEDDRVALFVIVTLFWIGYFVKTRI